MIQATNIVSDESPVRRQSGKAGTYVPFNGRSAEVVQLFTKSRVTESIDKEKSLRGKFVAKEPCRYSTHQRTGETNYPTAASNLLLGFCGFLCHVELHCCILPLLLCVVLIVSDEGKVLDLSPSVTPRTGSAVARYCPLWAWLHSHQPARFCSWELTEQLPRVVTHPGIAPASNSLNFGVPTNPKQVSSQKASRYEDARDPTSSSAHSHHTAEWLLYQTVTPQTGSAVARYCPLWAWLHSHQPARFCSWEVTEQLPRVVTHPGIAPASNSLNFGVPTNPKPVSSQKASRYEDARCAI
ncbi:hypothetical protein L3X38_007863 [Prunus dulcis]|uniref:Uncharacterized protein n=1 Tax=Prunus dulcis TaxID=3755 RepID=A0AAD4ZVB3_PRUDU|nr:hypothetical protein L3X38_007863 [Prunus dulcis]